MLVMEKEYTNLLWKGKLQVIDLNTRKLKQHFDNVRGVVDYF